MRQTDDFTIMTTSPGVIEIKFHVEDIRWKEHYSKTPEFQDHLLCFLVGKMLEAEKLNVPTGEDNE